MACLVAILTASLTLRQFYQQEIWLRKEQRYSEIISILSVILRYNDIKYLIFTNQISSTDYSDELELEYQKAKKELELLRYSSGFVIKPEVNNIINEIWSAYEYKSLREHQGDMEEYIGRIYKEIEQSMSKIIEIANDDLKKNFWHLSKMKN